jgi:asparagine synthase (glutamine-hydrolysing)
MRGKGWLRRMAVSGAERHQRSIGVFDSVERNALLRPLGIREEPGADPLFSEFFSDNRGEIENRMRCDLGTYLIDDILVKVDRNSMMSSLEVRVPLLDHRLVEFAASLPLNIKIKDGDQKWPLKELLRPLAPEQIISRPKQGFGMPIRDWLRTTYKDLAQDLLLTRGNRSHDYLDADAIRRMFTAHQKGQRDLSDRIWCLMWFEQWCRTFLV